MSGASGHFADGAGGESDDEDGAHNVCCAVTLCSVEEDLDEGKTRGSLHDLGGIAETETQCEDQDKAQGRIEDDSPCNSSWQRLRSVFDLFG